jgi:homocysteine S-methyltransferase
MTLQQLMTDHRVVILDGALATELERHGADLQHTLWSARYLLTEPERIERVHRDYLAAGAHILITASYQATIPGYLNHGYSAQQAHAAIRASVELAQTACRAWHDANPEVQSRRLVAGSVGPYGAYTADGGEYRGNYGLSTEQLIAFHLPRILTLAEAGVDFIACETIPDLLEAEALAQCVASIPGLTCWIAMSCRDGGHCNAGQSIESIAQRLQTYDCVQAVGVNCTDPRFVSDIVRRFALHTDKPIVAYPNSGEAYDAVSKTWSGTVSCIDYVDAARAWVDAGARIVGGCCRTTPEHIAGLAAFYLPTE